MPQSGAQMCSQDVSERMLGTFRSTENVFSVEERSDIGGGGFVALLHEIGRKTCRKRDKQGGNRLGLFTRKKKDNAPENRPVPRHIAVITDGNGRWATQRGLPRTAGHKAGAETFRRIATYCKNIGVKYLTVYAFSTENWKRSETEVSAIMALLKKYLLEAVDTMERDHIRLHFFGDMTPIAPELRALAHETDEITEHLSKDDFQANVCLNYGGRDEILRAVRRFAAECAEGKRKPEDLDETLFSTYLDSAGIPDPELIIRPSGEQRLSNFLLWQCAYSEFYYTDTLWPDFDEEELDKAIAAYQSRDRRFGGVKK